MTEITSGIYGRETSKKRRLPFQKEAFCTVKSLIQAYFSVFNVS